MFKVKSSDQIERVLQGFPKQRSKLPHAYQQIYNEHYRRNREGETKVTSLSSKLERWLHTTVAADLLPGQNDRIILEIGAGTLNHLPYEPQLSTYDIVEPFAYLYQRSENLQRVRNIYTDISEIELRPQYDRILSIAVFEHITDLPEVVARAALLLTKGGQLSVSIPNEGTLLWKLGVLVTGFEFKRMYGLDYQVLMRHEHVNNACEIENILRYFFADIRAKSFGLSRKFAFYRYFGCKEPDREKARRYISGKPPGPIEGS